MTIQDAFEWARHNHWHEPASMLDDKHTLADLDCNTVTRLLVSQRYQGELPDLSLFPHLNAFTSTKPVTTEYLAKQDLTVLKELNLYFEYGAGKIYLSLPKLEELTIAISNNDSDQLNIGSVLLGTSSLILGAGSTAGRRTLLTLNARCNSSLSLGLGCIIANTSAYGTTGGCFRICGSTNIANDFTHENTPLSFGFFHYNIECK